MSVQDQHSTQRERHRSLVFGLLKSTPPAGRGCYSYQGISRRLWLELRYSSLNSALRVSGLESWSHLAGPRDRFPHDALGADPRFSGSTRCSPMSRHAYCFLRSSPLDEAGDTQSAPYDEPTWFRHNRPGIHRHGAPRHSRATPAWLMDQNVPLTDPVMRLCRPHQGRWHETRDATGGVV